MGPELEPNLTARLIPISSQRGCTCVGKSRNDVRCKVEACCATLWKEVPTRRTGLSDPCCRLVLSGGRRQRVWMCERVCDSGCGASETEYEAVPYARTRKESWWSSSKVEGTTRSVVGGSVSEQRWVDEVAELPHILEQEAGCSHGLCRVGHPLTAPKCGRAAAELEERDASNSIGSAAAATAASPDLQAFSSDAHQPHPTASRLNHSTV